MATISSICSRVCSGGTPKSTESSYYGGTIPWLNTKEIDFNVIESTEKTISEAGLNNSSAKWVEAPCVIVAMYGATAGRVAISNIRLTTNQACCNLNIDSEKADYRFVYYALKNDFTRLSSMANGGAQQNLNAQQIKDFDIPDFSISEQKKIAAILSSLDEKIETNRKINARLEELAQALFKSWFIDFEPFGGQMPEDWNLGILSDELNLEKNAIKATDVGNLPYLPIDSIPMNHLGIEDYDRSENAQSSLITFRKNDILIGAMRVYFHRVILSPFDGVTRTTCFVLRPNKEFALPYLLLLCNQKSTIEYASLTSKGTTMPYAIWENGLGNMEIIIPSIEVLEKFYNAAMPLITKIRDSYKELRNIVSLRDTLLPKLMSGELIPE